MLINSECVAPAPSRQVALASSRRAAAAGPRQLAGFGPGAVMPECGRADLTVEGGRKSGVWSGGPAAASYLAGRLAISPALQSPIQASVVTKRTVQNSTVQNSTDQNSTDQHNSIQVTRLVPAFPGGVGPHPGREPRPA